MSALLQSLLDGFEPAAAQAGSLAAARRAALEALRADGLPPPRAETWKYTSLRALERRVFTPSTVLPAFDAATLTLPPAPRLVFVNGLLSEALSDLRGLPEGVMLEPLSRRLALGAAPEQALLAHSFGGRDEGFARANAALAQEGWVLRAAAGVASDQPIHLVLVGVPGADRAWHLRHLLQLGAGARLTVVEQRVASGAHAHLANEIAHVQLEAGAQLTHVRVQADADGASLLLRTEATLAADALYRRVDLELGAALSRHELNVALQGAQARLAANGVLLANGRRHLDTRLGIDHVARDGRCDLVWRGLGAGRGRAVFHGAILIREGADGTAAVLSNKNLLLSEGAEIDTQPVLEIHADEVQAAHGATVGRLDANALFYLRSRGLPAQEARALLTGAFCREILAVLENAALAESLGVWLDAALARLEPA